MESIQMVNIMKQRLGEEQYDWSFDEKKDTLRIQHKHVPHGLTLALGDIVSKYENKGDAAVDEVIYTITQTFEAMQQEQAQGFAGKTAIFPIIRSTSFPSKSKEGKPFVTTAHTAETRIFYALDLGTTYRLVDESMLPTLGMTAEQVREAARFAVRQLPTAVKRDEVRGNVFYFLNHNDGYDASRILNEAFLKEMAAQIEGDMTLSVPHQDVLIIGDIRNEVGYDVLAQMTMHFFTVGAVPITSLSFVYEDGHLEPIFILAKNNVQKEQDKQ